MNEEKQNEIKLSREQLDAVVADAVKKALGSRGIEKPKRVTERIAKVRFHNDKLVRKYSNVEEQRDERGKLVAYVDITLDGEEKPDRVIYLNFLDKTPQYRVLIKKTYIEEVVESEGEFRTVNPDEAKIERKNFTSSVEVAEVTKKHKKSDIEVMEGPYQGQTFTVVDNDSLNH